VSILLEIIIFVFNGLIGAVLRELLEDNKPINKESLIRVLIIGAISGYIYYYLHTDYSFPDNFMSIIFGYFSYDILPRLFRGFKSIMVNLKWQKEKEQ